MNINITLVAQVLAFLILIWLVSRLLWKPMIEALEARRKRIADGLAAAEQGKQDLEKAKETAEEELAGSRARAGEIIAQAEKRATEIKEEAKVKAREEADNIRRSAESDVVRRTQEAREQLRQEVAQLALLGAAQVLGKEVDAAAHNKALKELEVKMQSE